MKRFFKAIILFLVGCAIAAFAVANRHPVKFVLDPFIDRDIAYSVQAPFFAYLFISALAGILIGAPRSGLDKDIGETPRRRDARRRCFGNKRLKI